MSHSGWYPYGAYPYGQPDPNQAVNNRPAYGQPSPGQTADGQFAYGQPDYGQPAYEQSGLSRTTYGRSTHVSLPELLNDPSSPLIDIEAEGNSKRVEEPKFTGRIDVRASKDKLHNSLRCVNF